MANIDNQINDFLKAVYVRSHSEHTRIGYHQGIKKFIEFLSSRGTTLEETENKIRVNEIDVYKLLNDFVVFLDGKNLKPRTINHWIAAVKGYLRYCGIKIYNEDFKQVVRMPRKAKTKEIPLTKEIIVKLLRNVSPKLQTIILVLVASGMRIGELVQLKLSDIDFTCNPTKISLRAETTKTRTSRETFLTSEATGALKDYLKRYHGWDANSSNLHLQNKLIFGRTSVGTRLVKKEEELTIKKCSNAQLLLQKALVRAVKKLPDLYLKNENGGNFIHFHAFRKFFRTTVGNVCGRDFAEAIMGHTFYLDTYYQLTEEKKQEMYLKAEPNLTISDFKTVEKNISDLSQRCAHLEDMVQGLKQYMIKNSVEIPTYLTN